MIVRDVSGTKINEIVNHPEVRPWVGLGEDYLDLTPVAQNNNNIVLVGDWGGIIFYYLQFGMYECHTQAMPEGRGAWIDRFCTEAARWMFTRTPCFEIMTRVPKPHISAKHLAMAHGFRYEWTREKECQFRNRVCDVDIYTMRIEDWIAHDEELQGIGHRFHDLLHEAAERYGIKERAHPDDPNHNLYVGAAVEMALKGQPVKALLWYNRWAAVSRHPMISLLNRDPVTMQIDHGLIVQVRDGQLEVSHASARSI